MFAKNLESSLSNKNFIYYGTVRHSRFTPFKRMFSYKIFMTFFDINTIEKSFKNSFLFGINKRGLVSYFRKDYHGDQNLSLDEAVRKTIKTKTKYNPKGPIRILTHLRYFGYCFNPVSFFYCYNKEDTEVEMIMAEVTNTPWNERHCYFIDNKKNNKFKQDLKKQFHVSPFWDMDHDYEWYFNEPDKNLNVNMINFKDGNKIFNATLDLKKKAKLNYKNLILYTLRFPFLTLMVFLRIHFQALILLIRGATFYSHPKYKEVKN